MILRARKDKKHYADGHHALCQQRISEQMNEIYNDRQEPQTVRQKDNQLIPYWVNQR